MALHTLPEDESSRYKILRHTKLKPKEPKSQIENWNPCCGYQQEGHTIAYHTKPNANQIGQINC